MHDYNQFQDSMEAEMLAFDDIKLIVLAAFASITAANCYQWIRCIINILQHTIITCKIMKYTL